MIKYFIAMLIVGIMVAGAVVYGFTSTGSPFYVRMQKFDTKRTTDISSISYEVQNYYEKNKALPNSIDEIKQSSTYSSFETTDPETKKPYEYEKGVGSIYKLCANFSTSTLDDVGKNPNTMYLDKKYLHPKGRYCYSLFGSRNLESNNMYANANLADSNIKSVTTDALQIYYSNFPSGLFSKDTKESGLINYESKPVTVVVEFKKPMKIASVSTIFTNCESKDCYKWDVSGVTKDGTSLILAKDIYANEEVKSTATISDTSEFSKVILTAERLESFNSLYYVHLKKLSFSYSL